MRFHRFISDKLSRSKKKKKGRIKEKNFKLTRKIQIKKINK